MANENGGRSAPAQRFPEPDDTELNMTPMIDIVFQLIIFFLLSLKFKTVDQRIDAMLPDRGMAPTPDFQAAETKIKLKVFRRDLEDPQRTYTLIKVDNAAQYRLPTGWRGRRVELEKAPERVRQYDAVVASVQSEISKRLAIYGGADKVKGEISAPPPRGGAVPHGDVIALLDAFLREGVTNVNFEGTAPPLNTTERAARAAGRR